MLKETLKNYMDAYIKVYREAFGKYPQVEVDAEISEEPSVCFFGEKDEDGYIQWKYVEQSADFLNCRDFWTAVKKGIFPLNL